MSLDNLHAVIIAGGSGTRFWPLSRKARPKQFLPFAGDQSLLAATWQRLDGLVPVERRWVVAGKGQRDLLTHELPNLGERALLEPVARNTAPALSFAEATISRLHPDAIFVVLPADHYVRDAAAFRAALVTAAAAAAESGGIVTLGIEASRPDTGFGYIQRGQALTDGIYRVERFVEKPPLADAQKYVKSGEYYWNGGIFVFRASYFAKLVTELAPAIADAFAAYRNMPNEATLTAAFAAAPAISVDYAVMEKAPDVKVVPLACGWSDVGSWDALPEVQPADANGNTLVGNVLALAASGNIVRGQGHKQVCLIGVDDLIVVDTGDALLVMRKGEAQRVREVVAALERTGGALL